MQVRCLWPTVIPRYYMDQHDQEKQKQKKKVSPRMSGLELFFFNETGGGWASDSNMRVLLEPQMFQHIKMIISMEKGTCNYPWKIPALEKVATLMQCLGSVKPCKRTFQEEMLYYFFLCCSTSNTTIILQDHIPSSEPLSCTELPIHFIVGPMGDQLIQNIGVTARCKANAGTFWLH